jgi:chloramphenicol 3-O phosphotransferase
MRNEEKNQAGRIILLNGASSSGKSSIAAELQSLLEEPYMHLGIDTVFTMVPPKCKCDDPCDLKAFVWRPKRKALPEVEISVGDLGHKIMRGFHRACATLCDNGINLIIDHVLFEPRWTRECFELFEPFELLFVGVYCSLEVLERRERERGDRQIGLAKFTAFQAHKGQKYDLVVDTSSSSALECATQIVEYVMNPQFHRIHGKAEVGSPWMWCAHPKENRH